MKIKFFVDTYDGLTIEVNANEKTKQVFQQYFDCNLDNTYPTADYIVNYCGTMPKIVVPNNAKMLHAFLGAKYNVWNSNNKTMAYAESNQLKGSHLCCRKNNVIDVYVGPNENEEIVFRIVREIIFRYLISNGYVPMHASASIDNNNKAHLFFGQRGAGKTVMLCSRLQNKKESILATDVIMLNRYNDQFYGCGFPLRFSFDKKMPELFNIQVDSSIFNGDEKVRIPNSMLTNMFQSKMVWKTTPIEDFSQVKFNKDTPLSNSKIEITPESYDCYMDKWHYGDFLQLTPNTAIDFNNIYKHIKYKLVEGDFVKQEGDLEKDV